MMKYWEPYENIKKKKKGGAWGRMVVGLLNLEQTYTRIYKNNGRKSNVYLIIIK
jgi:hypothetical protein